MKWLIIAIIAFIVAGNVAFYLFGATKLVSTGIATASLFLTTVYAMVNKKI